MLFDEWDNSSTTSGGGSSSNSHQRHTSSTNASNTRTQHSRQHQSHQYDDSDDDLMPDSRMASASIVGGGTSGRGAMSQHSIPPIASLHALQHSSVISNPNDPSLVPTDQVGGLGGPSDSGGPMFQLERLDWRPSKEQGALVGLAVGSGVLLIATQNCNIIRWNVETDEFEEISISKRADDRIHKVFLDPTGHHGLIAMASGHVYYMHSRWNKAHLLTKVKGIVIESVAWNLALGTETSTKKILIGTNRGLIYETHIEEKDKYFKFIHDLCSDDGGGGSGRTAGAPNAVDSLQPTTPVSGLYMELFPSSVDAGEANHKWFVMAATPNRQFQFIGGPTFEALFARYTGSIPNAFKDFPGSLNYSELRFFSKYQGRSKNASMATADTCAWLNGVGIYYGNLVFGSQDKGQDVLQNGKLLAYPMVPDLSAGGAMRALAPLSLTLTEFHFLLVHSNRLLAINQLSEEIVYEEVFNTSTFGEMAGLATDARKDTVWLYSDKYVFAVDIVREDRDAWKLYLAEGKYDLALEYCDSDQQIERVNNARADYLFEQGSFEKAAQIYAETGRSFEEVALKFVNIASGLPVPHSTSIGSSGAGPGLSAISMGRVSAALQADARAALKAYLLAKLNTLEPTMLTQQLMCCTWLTEIFLDNINRLQEGAVESASAALRKRNGGGGGGSYASRVGGATSGMVSTTSPFPELSMGDADGDGSDSDSGVPAPGSDEAALLADERAQKQEDEVKEFRAFLHEFFDCLNRETTFELIASHGRVHELLFYAQIIHDLDWVLNYHIQQGNYFAALDILQHSDNPTKNADLYYKFCPTLMHFLPRHTADMLIDLGTKLDPSKLIPALMRYDDAPAADQAAARGARGAASRARAAGAARGSDDEEEEEDAEDEDADDDAAGGSSSGSSPHHSIRYLEHMIMKLRNRDPVLHNYLISLYARQKDEAPLLHFIDQQHAKKMASAGASGVYFDYKYALRVCHENGKLRACVKIYETMQLYEEATRLALDIDLELAKGVVSRSASDAGLGLGGGGGIDEQQRKRLWILIARHVITHERDMSKVMSILRQCDVQLEQILPFFPDFTRIGDFKEEMSKSLAQYNSQIEHLKAEMEEYTASANLIRQDISSLRSRYGVVSSAQKCDLCSQPVLNRHFFLFPCTHAFHSACCMAECSRYLAAHPALRAQVFADDEAREAAAAQQALLSGTSSASVSSHPAAAALAKSQAAAAAAEPVLSREAREARCLEHYAASECVLCGEIMIDSVSQPFINLPMEDAEAKAWEV